MRCSLMYVTVVTHLWGDAEHFQRGRHVGELRVRQNHVPEVHCERLAPYAEVADVEYREFLINKVNSSLLKFNTYMFR